MLHLNPDKDAIIFTVSTPCFPLQSIQAFLVYQWTLELITFNVTSETVVSQKSLENSGTSVLFTQADSRMCWGTESLARQMFTEK